jgi:hypothetical protein
VDLGAASSGCFVLPRENGCSLVGFGGRSRVIASRSWSDSGARGGGRSALMSTCGCTIMNGSMWFAC